MIRTPFEILHMKRRCLYIARYSFRLNPFFNIFNDFLIHGNALLLPLFLLIVKLGFKFIYALAVFLYQFALTAYLF